MIKLDRTRVTIPDLLTDPAGNGFIEAQAAIAFYSRRKIPEGEKFVYKVYALEPVKRAVSELSFDKCSYCESAVLAIDDGDVEHFRPKGEIKVDNKTYLKPGYYWLGSKWENLFLSCKHCNQARKQETPDGKLKTLGKKNQFPLSIDRKRIRTHTKEISVEEPYRLLIDPSKEDPSDFLEFDDKGLIFPRKKVNMINDPKGEATIEVFALLRKKLVEARKKHALTLMTALKTYEDLSKVLEENQDNLSSTFISRIKTMLAEQIQNLKVYTQEDQIFSGMSLSIVKAFLDKKGIHYNG